MQGPIVLATGGTGGHVFPAKALAGDIVKRDEIQRVLSQRKNRPMFLIDIAVPRNIDPTINTLDNVFLYDIDDMGRVVEGNRKGRLKEAEQAEAIIVEEV